ncbi:Lrp/AsnC family transcriptional regulator [Nitrosarchaeum koreense]|uniref:Transcriptional regulator, AsnC family n=1 Tax=Nitrosarchaeum koreense MY1 TaxID=1001994 RepID=F9CX78_9ARCH|nr:Lrp/AsnC family transcriptional regulator [Nitrosarchaeum koreense]EGP93880.1 Transcriptional regulator, AsnC family [Nitrosarchaeum koreense MY1]
MEFDETDTKIIKNLLVDARLSARQLAHKIGLSTVTVLSRIKKLEQKKIITGYTARLDHQILGYDLTAIIEVKTTKGKMLEIESKIAENENVCAVYDVTGPADILVISKFKNRNELSKFVKSLSTIANVENTETHIVLNSVKEDFRLS